MAIFWYFFGMVMSPKKYQNIPNIYKYIYIYIHIYDFFVKSDVFRQCQWDTSCRTRRELSNAIVKSDFRLTGVELWPFPFRNATPSVTSLIVV